MRGVFYGVAALTAIGGATYGAHELLKPEAKKIETAQAEAAKTYDTTKFTVSSQSIELPEAKKGPMTQEDAQNIVLITACSIQPADCNPLRIGAPLRLK